MSWTYDAWGNRTDQNVTAGTCGSLHATVNANNQFVGPAYQYDAAGNMTRDASHSYIYDAENRLLQTDGATPGDCATGCYAYDALGRRVEERDATTKIDHVYNLAGNVASEWCFPCGTFTGQLDTYIYFNGGLQAEFINSTTYFIHKDHLGSTRLATQLNQAPGQNLDYLPFGEQNSSDTRVTSHEFTSQEHDGESNLEHFWFRKYSSTIGRWTSPDPLGLAAADLSNPQSLNLYAYVGNDPLNTTDPTGTDWFDDVITNPFAGGYAAFYASIRGGGWSSGGWGNSKGCIMDGAPAPCDMAQSRLNSGAGAACPNNFCSGFVNNQFVKFDPNTGAYYQPSEFFSAANIVNGMRLTNAQYNAYILAHHRGDIDAQMRALASAFAANSGGNISYKDALASLNTDNGYLQGGNYNFKTIYGPGSLVCGAGADRCNGIHFTHGLVHLDTANPFKNPLGFAAHAFVDVFLGNVAYTVIPRPWP